MKQNLTISDIARMANVSKTTVSFILNNKEGVSEKTRQKVLSVIEETNYKPTLNSRRLFYHKSFTIAVVFDKSAHTYDNLFYFGIMNALLRRCIAYDYALIYSEYHTKGDSYILPDHIRTKDVDGLIFLKDIPDPLISELKGLNIPFVVVDDHASHDSVYSVKADYRLAAYTAVKHLLDQGHRKIGFVGNQSLPSFFSRIISGYEDALREAGIEQNPAWFLDNASDRTSTETALKKLLELDELPTALFCMEDMLAIEGIRFLQKCGKHVPDDMSVISVDDIVLSGQIYPGLTTVAIDKEEMGIHAIDLLMDLINGKETKNVTVSSNNLVIRESVASLT